MKRRITDPQPQELAGTKKRRKGIGKEIVSLLLAGALVLGSVPASAGELFGDGTQQNAESVTEADSQGTAAGANSQGTAVGANSQGTAASADSQETIAEADSQDTASEAEEETTAEPAEELTGDSAADSAFSSSEEDTTFGDGSTGTKRTLTDEELAAQLAPFENLSEIPVVEEPQESGNTNRGLGRVASGSNAVLPSKYDNRSNVTAAKSQSSNGMCWAFATASSMETSLIMQGLGDLNLDLSELHLAYFFANRQNDPLGNTAGDTNTIIRGDYRTGGNQIVATLFLSSWSGMALESVVPYTTGTSNLSSDLAYKTTAYLTDAAYQGSYNVSTVKSLIYEYGSVGMSLYLANTYSYTDNNETFTKTIYDAETCAYSCPVSYDSTKNNVKLNHAVTLVGWDDNYSKDNFPADCNVTSDGAWIAKNSWGSGWGDNGYFYISYETKSHSNMVAVKGTTNPEYPNNYFYDGSSIIASTSIAPENSSSGSTYGANVFTAEAGNGKAEVLGEVVVETYTSNNMLGIQVYTNLTDPDDPTSGVPAFSEPVEFYQEYAGISTVPVPEVTLTQGTLYSVVISNLGTASVKYLVEKSGTAGSPEWLQTTAEISPEDSFLYRYVKSTNSWEWTDLATLDSPFCLRIKAHTRTLDSALSVSAPSNTAASSAAYNQIKLSWSAVSGVSGYEIYRKTSGGSYKKLAEVSYDARSYTDKSVNIGTKYTYRVRAFSVVNGDVLYGKYSAEVQAKAALTTPTVTVEVSNKMYNGITWGQVSGASGYYVYRKTPGGSWKQIASVKKTVFAYRDKDISAGASYEYTVRAWRKVSGSVVKSAYKSSGAYKSSPAVQAVKSVKNTTAGIKLTWSSQTNCDGYYIYRQTNSGKWEYVAKLGSGKRSSYTDKTVEKGKKYVYAVRAFVKEPDGTILSRFKKSKAITRK